MKETKPNSPSHQKANKCTFSPFSPFQLRAREAVDCPTILTCLNQTYLGLKKGIAPIGSLIIYDAEDRIPNIFKQENPENHLVYARGAAPLHHAALPPSELERIQPSGPTSVPLSTYQPVSCNLGCLVNATWRCLDGLVIGCVIQESFPD